MSVETVAQRQLSAYDAEQVRQIAMWKSDPPNPLAELWKMIVVPVAKVVEKVVPDSMVGFAIERAYDVSALLAGQKDILTKAGVKELSELHAKPLEECDGLSKRVGLIAESLAALEGVATGANKGDILEWH
jgi:hypothetical protein